MAATRITFVEMHAKLGATNDRAVIEPVIDTKHGLDHIVRLSAERYEVLVAAADAVPVRQHQPRAGARKARSA